MILTAFQRQHGCSECSFRFHTISRLRTHIKGVHLKDKSETCHLCPKAFSEKSTLKKHLRQHGAIPLLKCVFEGCEEKFVLSATKRKHQQQVHGADAEKLTCNQCNLSFEHFMNLRYHNEKTHSNAEMKKVYTCEICQKVCKDRGLFNSHLKVHSTERKFSCEECGKSFKYKLGLNYHIKTHKGLKDFSCEVCGKELTSKIALTVHMNNHEGFKPYNCSLCPRQFTQSTSLKKHEKRHINGTLKVHVRNIHCDKCDKSYCGKRGLRRHRAEAHKVNTQEDGDIDADIGSGDEMMN